MKNNFLIWVHNDNHREAVLDRLEELGYTLPEHRCLGYAYVGLDEYAVRYVSGSRDREYGENQVLGGRKVLALDSLYQEPFMEPQEIKVVLNIQYTATVTKDGVKVGCQEFPLEIIEDLKKAKDELTNS